MPDRSFRRLLSESLPALRDECPPAHLAMQRALEGVAIAVCFDGDRFTLAVQRGALRIDDAQGDSGVEAVTSRDAVLDLVAGRLTLAQAVEQDRLQLRGSVDDLLRLHDGLIAYVAGAVRSPSFPGLLERFRHAGRGESPLEQDIP